MIFVLIEKKSDTPTDTGHFLMMISRYEASIIYTLPFNFPTDDYYRLHPFNRIPFTTVLDYTEA
jgi:hypothetical protein